MSDRHYYKGLDESGDYDITTKISMRELAEKLVDTNYGVHRLLSHLVDVRREKLDKKIAAHEARGDHDIADYCRRRGDPLMEMIANLLDAGEY